MSDFKCEECSSSSFMYLDLGEAKCNADSSKAEFVKKCA